MLFKEFACSENSVTATMTKQQYMKIRPFLRRYYKAEDLRLIDIFCRCKCADEVFLLCNPVLCKIIGAPVLLVSSYTFTKNVPFENITFENKETTSLMLRRVNT